MPLMEQNHDEEKMGRSHKVEMPIRVRTIIVFLQDKLLESLSAIKYCGLMAFWIPSKQILPSFTEKIEVLVSGQPRTGDSSAVLRCSNTSCNVTLARPLPYPSKFFPAGCPGMK